MMEVADVAGATTLVADLALASASTALPAHQVLSTSAAAFEMASPEMAAQLARVLDAARTGGLSGVTSDQALQVVEAVEALKAWGDSISLDATAVMVTELESDFSHLAPESLSSRGWQLFLRHCRSAAAREIQVATGLPITQCQRRVWLTACEPERVASMLGAMRAGRVTLSRAITLAEATRHLDGLTAAAIMARVLRPLTGPGGVPLPGVAPLSEATFRVRLHKQLVLHHGLVGEAERTYTEAVRGRRLSTEPQRDGTGLMLISGDGPRIAAAQGRVDTIARRLRQGGDDRTLDQLRTDVATDLLMRGWIPNDPMFAALGNPPAAVVRLIVSLPTVLGVDQGVGHITGWGDVTSQQARELALQYGSIWKRVVTDPITGRAIEVSAPTYRVPAGMAEQINARDRTCRAPGCEVPGDLCDHDHSNEWELDGIGGPTAETNLADLHRGHHNLKTAGFWDSHQSRDGTLIWTTATGRTVITYPYIYDHPDNLPVKTSHLEATYGRQVAQVINPDIVQYGQLNIFEEMAWARALAPTTPSPTQHIWTTTHDESSEPADRKPSLSGEPPF
jgi:hypothetical protein